jgi:hypothetical protein
LASISDRKRRRLDADENSASMAQVKSITDIILKLKEEAVLTLEESERQEN